mmetsp:Transcript_16727/g.42490  ORF Transcript_16727/g.42490 Transcript_16727/m.42490 type:complete len:350 (-) Transcript_16727:427-1476(-)
MRSSSFFCSSDGRSREKSSGVTLAKTVQHAKVAVIFHVVVEKDLAQGKKHRGCEQAIRASLVHGSHALGAELLGKLVETGFERGALHLGHDVLDVVQAGKVGVQQAEELLLLGGQRRKGEELEQVAKIVTAVERDPLDVLDEDKAGTHKRLAELVHIDPHLLVQLKVDAAPDEKIDRVLGVHVVGEAELEVELPARTVVCEIAILVGKRDAELDELEQVHVAAQRLVLKVNRAIVWPDRAGHHTRKLSVHGHVVELGDGLPDGLHFFFEVVPPHVADLQALALVLVDVAALLELLEQLLAERRRRGLAGVGRGVLVVVALVRGWLVAQAGLPLWGVGLVSAVLRVLLRL